MQSKVPGWRLRWAQRMMGPGLAGLAATFGCSGPQTFATGDEVDLPEFSETGRVSPDRVRQTDLGNEASPEEDPAGEDQGADETPPNAEAVDEGTPSAELLPEDQAEGGNSETQTNANATGAGGSGGTTEAPATETGTGGAPASGAGGSPGAAGSGAVTPPPPTGSAGAPATPPPATPPPATPPPATPPPATPPAQSNCSLSVAVTTVSPGARYAPRNVGAIWIATSAGEFVKSLEVWGNRRLQHVEEWNQVTTAAGAARNTVDAVTSATLTNHRAHNLTWNCRDYEGQLVPDGTYRVYFEVTEANGAGPNHFESFTKGASAATVQGSAANFSGIALRFTP